jgi:hypothetical protein
MREVLGVDVTETPADHHFDLLVDDPRGKLRIEVKSLTASRLDDLRGRVAETVLRSERVHRANAVALVVPTFGDRAISALSEFSHEFSRGLAWLLVGRDGRIAGEIPLWDLTVDERANEPEMRAKDAHLFTDLNRWMLKLLLLQRAPSPFDLGIGNPFESQAALAAGGRVSPATVHRLVRALDMEGFLAGGRAVRLTRVPQLLHMWLVYDSVERPRPWPGRWALGAPPSLADGFNVAPLPGVRVALAGFAACHELRLGIVPKMREPPLVYVDAAVRPLAGVVGLVACEHRDADVLLARPKHPESVFRATAVGALPTVDAIQAALDVVSHPARGREQAEHIVALMERWNS